MLKERLSDEYGIFECPICYSNFKTKISDTVYRNRKSCGCINYNHLEGKRFGKLKVIKELDKRTKFGQKIWQCKCDCGTLCEVSTPNLVQKHTQSCGCLKSRGEEKIKKILNQLEIKYFSQYRFVQCKQKRPLPFDFYLPDYNTCIEYDGIQHFCEEKWLLNNFHYSDRLQDRQIRDKIKTQYCKNNNIKLIRIPYWDYNKIDTAYILEKLNEEWVF